MLPFRTLILPDKNSTTPIYRQITDQLIEIIKDGTLLPGRFLPGTRQMADLLKVNRKTIINAYEELKVQNWIDAVPQKGYRVIPELSSVRPRTFIPKDNFGYASKRPGLPSRIADYTNSKKSGNYQIQIDEGSPDPRILFNLELGKRYMRRGSSQMGQQWMFVEDLAGLELTREACSEFLNNSRGLNIDKQGIMMTCSAKAAVFLAASVLLSPGDIVVMGDPGCHNLREVINNAGATIIYITLDEHGINVDQLEIVLRQYPVKLLYIAPHHHYPTTASLSAERRGQILSLLYEHDFWIIEDDLDYDFTFHNSPVLPLASANHGGKVIYIGAFTRTLSEFFRVGYLVAKPEIVSKAIQLKSIMDLKSDVYMEHLLASMIRNGDLNKHIKKANRLYRKRYDFICNLFQAKLSHVFEFNKPSGGLALWLRFKPGYPFQRFISMARKNGIFINAAHLTPERSVQDSGVRFGFASMSEAEMEKVVEEFLHISHQLQENEHIIPAS